MPKKVTKKKSKKPSSETIDSDFSSSESETENNQDFNDDEDIDNDINDSDFEEDINDEEYDDNDDIQDMDSIKSVQKNEDKEDDCFFAFNKEDDIDLFDEDDFDQDTVSDEILKEDERISVNRMSLYEFVRLIGTRTKQLSMGAKPMIKNTQGLSSKEIAILELKNNTLPLIIKRPLPDNRFEIWKINELEKNHLFDE